ncbi:hypothetical protein QBC37DRAFT_101941 [Rhypophila decipiens]|uniref:Zn(2)-C6 fungal-type domain-containing protein n=1 Tax=Rhypophila decipiens TaxID=261697 RepID=A0AAN6XUY0_9PEZI|nr:hypothetical protein QBC37DRAFT_101941 [Rhypophila decipiens]
MASNDTATAPDFEHLLDFGDTNAKRSTKPLACARCHGQKLRCVRGTADGRVCDRCLAAGLNCTGRRPQRMGRPSDITLRRRKSRSKESGLPNAMQIVSPLANTNISQESGNFSFSSPPPETGTPSCLLSGLDDLATLESLFPGGIDVGSFDFQQLGSEVNLGGNPPPVQDNDPIEHLSQLHLELYRCLLAVKPVEKMKRDKLRGTPEEPGRNIDTTWSQNLFRTTERFIEVLRAYVAPTSANDHSAPSSTTSVTETDKGIDMDTAGSSMIWSSASHIDTATGLLIVSCYSRLVQIFDVVVFVVETFRDMNCPGEYVQVQFGSFTPAANKSLQARILGQYVLHLLEGVSEAAERATASGPPYARAVAEVQSDEAKLRERILASLH